MNKQEQRIIDAARKVLSNWIDGGINADVSGDFNELEYAFNSYDNPSSIDFDWQSFRAEAAKNILCSIIQGGYYGDDIIAHQSELAVGYANELVKQLKERELSNDLLAEDYTMCP